MEIQAECRVGCARAEDVMLEPMDEPMQMDPYDPMMDPMGMDPIDPINAMIDVLLP